MCLLVKIETIAHDSISFMSHTKPNGLTASEVLKLCIEKKRARMPRLDRKECQVLFSAYHKQERNPDSLLRGVCCA